MTTRRPQAGGWLPFVGLVGMVAGVVFQAGILTSRIERNTERITLLEANERVRSASIETMNLRGARIEAKLDLIAPHQAEATR